MVFEDRRLQTKRLLGSDVQPWACPHELRCTQCEFASSITDVAHDATRTCAGTRYKCLVCQNYDQCSECKRERVESEGHEATHPMQPLLCPSDVAEFFGGMRIVGSFFLCCIGMPVVLSGVGYVEAGLDHYGFSIQCTNPHYATSLA